MATTDPNKVKPSRVETILMAMLGESVEIDEPKSRVEELLLQLKEAIEQGGGSGFTPTQEQLDAMNSGIDVTKVAQIDTNENDILSVQHYETSKNYPQNLDIVTHKLINADGGIVDYSVDSYTVSTIDVSGWKKMILFASANFGNSIYVIKDINGVVLKKQLAETGNIPTVINNETIDVPTGAKYLIAANIVSPTRPTIAVTKIVYGMLASELTQELYEAINKGTEYYGKKWVVVGDSLTEVNSRTTKHYFDYVADTTGITTVNYGVSGTGYKRDEGNNNAFYQRVSTIPLDADVVTIFGSGNDLTLISDLGTPTDTGTTTICGCINTTIDNIISRLPTVSLGIVSPTPWSGNQPTIDDSNNMALYTKALMQICYIRSIPFLDLYHSSNLRPWTQEGREACYSKDNGSGVHPDETGHRLIAGRFKTFIETLLG
jgi:lysophospholipase L1-like esterase